MTEEDRLLLNELNANTKRLFQEFKNLKAKNEMLKNRIDVFTEEMARSEHEKNEQKEKIEKLKIANQILAGQDKDGEAKKRISALIREIDRCIALLNK
jgi:septal ring factor EnvC (AmiA/AmiB activator)